jgi:rhodanese-related sulfurtransferase
MTLLSKLLGRKQADAVVWVDPAALRFRLDSAVPPLVIDVRRPDEFDGPLGHIDTARNIPLDQLAGHIHQLVGEVRPLVLVCHTDRRSAAAAEQLRAAGLSDVGVLRGGMVAWRAGQQ